MNYKEINVGLDLGTKFLTNQTAYFLGLLMANEKTTINSAIYWQAPVRHNPKSFNYTDLERHYNYIKQIAVFLNKTSSTHLVNFYKKQDIPIEKYNAGKNGILTLFKELTSDYSIEDLISDVYDPLLNSFDNIKRSFLIGVFDGRGSYDKTANFIVLDYDKLAVKEIIEHSLNELGIKANINSKATARVRKDSGSAPRKKQIRIKHIEFLQKIGFVSPTRFDKATTKLFSEYEKVDLNNILPGLKGIINK